MRFDSLHTLIRERYPEGNNDNLGEACAESSRLGIVCKAAGVEGLFIDQGLCYFFKDGKIIRHPQCTYTDISQDQLLPLYLCLNLYDLPILLSIYKSIDIYSEFKNYIGPKVLGQAYIFKFPWRWNDGKKCIESTDKSACDYLNFICQILYAEVSGKSNWMIRQAMRVIPAEKAKAKVHMYYLEGDDAEPNSLWLVNLYFQAIDKWWIK